MNKVLRGEEALKKLINEWGIPEDQARRVLEIAVEHGINVTNSGDMLSVVTVRKLGRDPYTFSLTPGVPSQEDSGKKIPPRGTRATIPGYTSGSANVGSLATGAGGRAGQPANRRDRTMAKAAAAEVEEEATDLTAYLEKDITPTVNDYIDFLVQELGEGAEIDERSVYYAITLYKYFQGSDFSRERKEARRAEREAARTAKAAANGAAETEDGAEETPKTRRGRKPATEAPADKATTPARRGRPAGKPATGGTAPRRRGRPAGKPAAASEPAPY